MKRTLIFLLLIGGLFALIGGGGAVQVQGQGTSPLGIVPEPSELQVNIWVDKPAYRVGEEIVIHFWINRPAWVYIIDIDAAGYARLIFPNRFDRDNYIDQAGEYSLPGPSDPYRFVVVPPTGTEYLQIIASTQPLPLDVQGFREAFPLLGTDPGQVGAQIQGIIPVEAETATAWTSFQVFTHWPPPPPPPTNRPPVASFTWDPYYPWVSQLVTFNASSSYDPDGWITAYRWDFNSDGITDALGAVVTHAFTYSGSHPVTLTVVDNLGAAASITHTVWVRGYVPPPPPPPAPAAGFYIDIEPGNVLHITVQGSPGWLTDHGYRIELETDGCFTSVHHQISGGVAPLGIVPTPTPTPQATLTLSGSVSTGRVDYFITLSCGATKIKFKMLLDWDGDGDLDLRTDNIYIGPSRRNPPSNPFVLHFPSGTLAWVYAQICWVLVDQPGFQFIICFTFDP